MQLAIRHLLPTYFDQVVTDSSEIWGKDLVFEKGDFVKCFHFGVDVFSLCNTSLYNMVKI